MVLLGAPIGSPEFCAKHARAKVSDLAATFSMLKRLEDTQVAYTLLRQCASFGKMVYTARTVPPEFHQDALAEYDASVQEAFGEITGIRKGGDTWLQASLSIKRGGLGLRPTALHADASYLSSRVRSSKLCRAKSRRHGDARGCARAECHSIIK